MKIFVLCILFTYSVYTLGASIDKLNSETCNVLRAERRAQVYATVGIKDIASLSKKFISSSSTEEMNLLKSEANVPAFDPFWASDKTKKADEDSKKKFAQISSKVLDRIGLTIDGKEYKRADGTQENGTPFIRLGMQGPKFRETLIATKPTVSVARVFSDSKLLKLDYLNKYPSLIFVVEQNFFGDGALAQPNLQIIAGDSSLNFSSLIEETMPEYCKSSQIQYDPTFDSIDQNIKVVDDSSKNKLKVNPVDSTLPLPIPPSKTINK